MKDFYYNFDRVPIIVQFTLGVKKLWVYLRKSEDDLEKSCEKESTTKFATITRKLSWNHATADKNIVDRTANNRATSTVHDSWFTLYVYSTLLPPAPDRGHPTAAFSRSCAKIALAVKI